MFAGFKIWLRKQFLYVVNEVNTAVVIDWFNGLVNRGPQTGLACWLTMLLFPSACYSNPKSLLHVFLTVKLFFFLRVVMKHFTAEQTRQ